MVKKRPRSHVYAPNYKPEAISDEDLTRGSLLDLGASGRSPKTLFIYGDSVKRLSAFARDLDFPPLAVMDKDHVRHWLLSLYENENKPATVHVRYRSINRFFKWCIKEGERQDNPVDCIDPPRLPEVIQPYYDPADVEAKRSLGVKDFAVKASAMSAVRHACLSLKCSRLPVAVTNGR
jgi:site-specific recombinase XerD